jgi:hypothetical protein
MERVTLSLDTWTISAALILGDFTRASLKLTAVL